MAGTRRLHAERRPRASLGVLRRAAIPLVAGLVLSGCSAATGWTPPPAGPTAGMTAAATAGDSADPAAELRALVEDVTGATAAHFGVSDDLGRGMDTLKVIEIPERRMFAAVYHAWNEDDDAFHVHLATSPDLERWTWQREIAGMASQPTIAASSDGGYVVAWEQEPDPIHLVVERFASWDDLLGGVIARRHDLRVTMPACGEGTPSIEAATARRVELGFHYHGGCVRDREAGGTLDGTFWDTRARPEIDTALEDLGVAGHIGDRDRLVFQGRDLMLVEGQRVLDDPSTWRTFLYDPATRSAEELHLRTPAGSTTFMNPTIGVVEVGGRRALLVTLYVGSDGARGGEDGPLLYYRLLP